MIRVQFLLTSNAEERKRYAQKKLKIEETAQAVRDNTADLRVQLAEAQSTLAMRKEYDALAEKITSNRLLRPRDEQHANLQKLHAEIAELERESQEYAETWNRRRQQFDKIIDQTTEMQHQIKDEKEEVERREGMEEREDADDEPRGGLSGNATPKADGGATPMQGVEKDSQSDTLGVDRAHTRGRTPLRESQLADDTQDNLSVIQDGDDGEMAEDGEVSNDPDDNRAEHSETIEDKEEGEQDDDRHAEGRMDVT